MNPYGDDLIVDQVIGSAYQVVKYVAANMSTLVELADAMDTIKSVLSGLQDIIDNMPQLLELQAELPELLEIHANLVELLDIQTHMAELLAIHGSLDALLIVYDNLAAVIDAATSLTTSLEAIRRSYAEINMPVVGTFAGGCTVTSANQIVVFEGDGKGYSWGGSLNKIVPPDSTPATTGGVSAGAWVDQSTKLLSTKLTTMSGELVPVSAWTPVPAFSDPDFGPELNAQAQALFNRLTAAYAETFVTTKEQLLANLNNSIPSNITVALHNTSFNSSESALLLSKLNLVYAMLPVTLRITGFTTLSGNIANIGQNQGITLEGAPTVDTTLVGIASVTGTLGNWSVVCNLASAAGMAVGDVLRIDSVGPGVTYASPVDGVRNARPNELAVGAYFMGEATTTTGGITVTLSIGSQNSYLAVGDLVHIHGQTRTITSISPAPAKTFTVDVPWTKGITGLQWWYFTKPNTGTLLEGGTTVNGTGTLFLSQANIGDALLCNGEMRKITNIISDTQLTVTHAITVAAGTKYTILTGGILHEGSFKVVGVSGNQVTIINRSRYAKPPVNAIYGGAISCIKTVLVQSGAGSGFVFERGANLGEFRNIALCGAYVTTSIGMALNGTQSGYSQGSADVVMGFGTAVIEFGYGAFLTSGCTLEAWKGHFTNNADTGVWCGDGATAYLRNAVCSHNGGLGAFGSGGFIRLSSARLCGNTDQGVRLDVGAGAYGDAWFTWGNGSHGYMGVNFCGVQYADGYAMCNGGSGADFQNAAGGRVSRTLFGCNAINGLSVVNGKVEATQTWETGNSSSYSGVICQRGEVDLLNSAQTGNGYGIRGTSGAFANAEDSFQTANTYGIRSEDVGTLISSITAVTTGNNTGNRQTVSGTITSTEIPGGVYVQSAHYSNGNLLIADDSVAKIYCGSQMVILTFASLSAGISGQVRLRCGSNQSTLMTGTGILVTTGVLTGTTGADGTFTVSAAGDGYCYIENRLGASRTLVTDIIGNII